MCVCMYACRARMYSSSKHHQHHDRKSLHLLLSNTKGKKKNTSRAFWDVVARARAIRVVSSEEIRKLLEVVVVVASVVLFFLFLGVVSIFSIFALVVVFEREY